MKTVTAKFKIDEIKSSLTHRSTGTGSEVVEVKSVVLSPVYGNSEENKQFFAATPSGRIELGILNPEAGQAFELGKEYYVTFTQA